MPKAPVFILGPQAKDITGQVFGRLTVTRPERKNAWNEWYWRCLCECGRSHVAPGKSLRSTRAVECRSCANYRARYGLAPENWADRADFNADRQLRLKRRWRDKRRTWWQTILHDPTAHVRHLEKRRASYARARAVGSGADMNQAQYDQLASVVFRGDYPGYRPDVKELPNGDGKIDAEKRYAHVAEKYLRAFVDDLCSDSRDCEILEEALEAAHFLACSVADALEVPFKFSPDERYGALRILEYPVGATSNLHTDFDLFTLMIYRDQPECFVAHDHNFPCNPTMDQFARLREARKLNAQLHIGELGELIGLGPATPHEVIASDRPQHAIVYFAIPSHDAVLPSGQTVGEWLTERMARSRITYK